MKTLQLTLDNFFNRSSLFEGRNFGIGFAFVTPTRKNSIKKFKTMQAFSACKDYLNDLVYVEKHNTPLEKIHGFQHTYTGYFKDNNFVYLGAKPVHFKNGQKWPLFQKASDTLKDCSNELVQSINKLEDLLNLSEDRTTLYGTTKTEYIFKIPIIWVEKGWLISLLTLWIRCFFNVSKEDINLPLKELVDIHKSKIFIAADAYLYNEIEKFIKRNDFNELLNINAPKLGDKANVVHNLGISNFQKTLKPTTTNEKKKVSTIIS